MNEFSEAAKSLASDEPVEHLAGSLTLTLTITDPHVVAVLSEFIEGGTREEFAVSALRIGILALKQAQGELDAAAIRNEGERLLASLEMSLDGYGKLLTQQLTGVLKDYFDPQCGRFHERVERLIRQDGELEQVLRRSIGSDGSELCKTLLAHVGEQSPLMAVLSPQAENGLAAELRRTLEQKLLDQREQVLRQFSLDTADGALSRFLKEIRSHYDGVSGDLTQKIEKAVGEFSLDNENSALSRLVQRVSQAQATITREFSLDDEKSSLSRLRREMFSLLDKHGTDQRAFQEEVKLSLKALHVRKQEEARSTLHGRSFEEAVSTFVSAESNRLGDVATACGSTVGRIKNCKIGDVQVELGPESAAPQARFVVEAKEDATYNLRDALEELARARDNRDAQIGLFVFSAKIAPPTIEPFARYGSDIVVVWDVANPSTNVYLRAGLSLARAMCVRAAVKSAERSADLDAIERAVLDIEKRVQALDEIRKSANTIQTSAEKILKSERLINVALQQQLEILRDKTSVLKNILQVPSN